MLRLDASVPAIAERAISSYDYVHAAISTYPAFLCMNFDIRAVAFPFNSVYTDFPPPLPPELFGGGGEGKKGRERNRGVGRKLIVTSRIRLFIFQNTKTSVHERNFFNINFISPSFLHWLKTVAMCNDRLGNFLGELRSSCVYDVCNNPIVPRIKSVPHKFFPVCEDYRDDWDDIFDRWYFTLHTSFAIYISYFPLGI